MLKNNPLPSREECNEVQRSLIWPDFPPGYEAFRETNHELLEPTNLLNQARAATGLNDFGSAPLDEHLNVLCQSINEELVLSKAGYANLHQQLVGILSIRLKFEDLWKKF